MTKIEGRHTDSLLIMIKYNSSRQFDYCFIVFDGDPFVMAGLSPVAFIRIVIKIDYVSLTN